MRLGLVVSELVRVENAVTWFMCASFAVAILVGIKVDARLRNNAAGEVRGGLRY
jgi:uncharacterized protein YebE (UPF0316 family)